MRNSLFFVQKRSVNTVPHINRYLCHSKSENFFTQTIPSFFHSFHIQRKAENSISWRTIQALWGDQERPNSSELNPDDSLSITWLGHATVLIRCGKTVIITDPITGSLPFFPRMTEFGVQTDRLPPIDITLISHNHRDHMDTNTLALLAYKNRAMQLLFPHGDAGWFPKKLFPNGHECLWNDELIFEHTPDDPIRIIFLPAYHWSRRSLFDTNRSLWGSYLIQWRTHSIYFAGDTAYFEHFSEIAQNYKVSTALLPIGPVEPREWMKRSHLCPHEAGKAFFDLGATQFIPIHWGTFGFGIDQFDTPIRQLHRWQQEQKTNLVGKQILPIEIGKTIIL